MNKLKKAVLDARIESSPPPKAKTSKDVKGNRDIYFKRPCLHSKCIGNSQCKQAATYGNGRFDI